MSSFIRDFQFLDTPAEYLVTFLIEIEIQFQFQNGAPYSCQSWSDFMRFFASLVLIVGIVVSASAQQSSQQLSSQVDRLTALVEQQQKQIEQLQKSQAELLQQISAQKGGA